MNKTIGVGLISILTILFLASCGVSQDKFDKLNGDLAVAQAQTQAAQSALSAKESELQAEKAKNQSLQGDLALKEKELQAANDKIKSAKTMIEVLNGIFIPTMTGEIYDMTAAESIKFILKWSDQVKAVGDPTLTAKFEAMLSNFDSEAAPLAFFKYLLESLPKTLAPTTPQ